MVAKPKAKASPKALTAKPAAAKPGAAKPGAAKPGAAKPGAAKRAAQASNVVKPQGAAKAKRPAATFAADLGASDRLERLWAAVQQVRDGQRDSLRTARLLAAGPPKLAQKVVEEAAEVAIEAVIGNRDALVNESVDLLYNLVTLWNGLGIGLQPIWAEMDRREAALGMAEKLPKSEDV